MSSSFLDGYFLSRDMVRIECDVVHTITGHLSEPSNYYSGFLSRRYSVSEEKRLSAFTKHPVAFQKVGKLSARRCQTGITVANRRNKTNLKPQL
jgi:hypothetical protein